MNGVVLHDLPTFLPLEEIDEFCKALQEIREAGQQTMLKAEK
jgi:hypothetical protein